MTHRKRLKLTLLWPARALGIFALARLLTARTVKMLCYHYVSVEDEHTRFPTLFVSPETFRRRLEHVRRHYQVIGLADAVSALESGRSGKGRVVLTFDDGHQNFLTGAVPLLREFGVTATMYVVTGHLAEDTPFSMMLVRDVLKQHEATALTDPIPEIDMTPRLNDAVERAAFERAVIRHMASLPPSSLLRLEFARRVGHSLDVDVDGLIERRIWGVLRPDEIKRLSDEGFDMQVHGHTHLEVVDYPDQVFDQASTCRTLLEEITGKEARAFCYPSGRWHRAAWDSLKRAGIRSATTTQFGPNSGQTPVMALRRNVDAESITQLEFEYELSGLHWLLWALRNFGRRWMPSERLVGHMEDPSVF